jgi:hypothetical protein
MANKDELQRARESFAIPDGTGGMRTIAVGELLRGNDPLLKTHSHLFESASTGVEQATAAPGERRSVTLPEGRPLSEVVAPHPNEGDETVVHHLPPEHPDSPASPFAPAQPAAGVVADDVPKEQNPGGGIPAAKASAKKVGADKANAPSDPEKGAGPVPTTAKS